MTARAPRPTRFLSVAFDGSYGIRIVKVTVSVADPASDRTHRESSWHTARATGSFRGEALEDFAIRAYAGHAHPFEWQDPAEIWGWQAVFEPSAIHAADHALRIARTLQALSRAMEATSYGEGGLGHPETFPAYLRRIAAILRCTEIRIYQPTGHGGSFLGGPLPLTTGPDLVEAIGRGWAEGNALDRACRRAQEEARSPLDTDIAV